MSYCVHCGVELDATASFCPSVPYAGSGPRPTGGYRLPKPFPTRRGGGAGGQTGGGAAHYRHARLGGGVLRRTQSVSAGGPDVVAVRHRRGGHAVAVAGAAAAGPGMHLLLRLLLDIAAVALYVYLISGGSQWGDWYLGLAAPIILWGGAILLLLGLVLRVYRRSALTTMTILIGSIGASLCLEWSFCGPLAAPALESVLVPGGAHHLHRNGDSAHHYSPRPRPPGGGAQKVPSLKDVLDRSTARKLE